MSPQTRVPTPITAAVLALLIPLAGVVAYLNSSYRTPRPKVSLVKADMRSLATGLDAYYSDHGAYPPSTIEPNEKALFPGSVDLPSFRRASDRAFILTTPIAYYSRIPADTCGYLEYVPLLIDEELDYQHTFAYWALLREASSLSARVRTGGSTSTSTRSSAPTTQQRRDRRRSCSTTRTIPQTELTAKAISGARSGRRRRRRQANNPVPSAWSSIRNRGMNLLPQ